MRNQSGQSLIQVMVAMAVMCVVCAGMTSILNNFSTQNRALSEKLASVDLGNVLLASLSNGSVCNYLLQNRTFNSNLPMSTSSPVVVAPASPRIYASYDPSATPPLGPVIAEVGQLASPYSESLKVSAINLELTGRSGTTFTGRWRVDFDGTKLVRPIKPVFVSVTLSADTSDAANAKVTSCQGSGTTAAASDAQGMWCGAFQGTDGYPTDSINIIYSKCKDQVPVCATPTSFPMSDGIGGTTSCSRYSSLCPSGYTLTKVMSTGQYSMGDGVHGLGEVGGPSTTNNNLYTCMH